MQWTQFGEGENVLDDLVGNQSGGFVNLAAVQNAMANGGNFLYGVNDLAFSLRQDFDHFHKRFLMGGERRIAGNGAAVRSFMGDQAIYSNPFAVALGQNSLILHVDQLIF